MPRRCPGEWARPHGTLRLSLCPALARRRLLEPTAAFLRERPQVRVLMHLEDRVVDPVHQAVDVAVRVGAMGDSHLDCRRLCTYEHVLVAAPKYLCTAPPLREPADLAHHALIGIQGSRAFMRWGFMLGGQRTEVEVLPRVETNDAEVLVGMTVAGAGVTVLPDYLAEEDLDSGRLLRALDHWRLSTVPIFAVYASASGLPRVDQRDQARARGLAAASKSPKLTGPRTRAAPCRGRPSTILPRQSSNGAPDDTRTGVV